MRREECDHIRDDVATAILEVGVSGDMSVGPQILDLLLTEIEKVATVDGHADRCNLTAPFDPPFPGCTCEIGWAEDLLRKAQLRATSGVPFGEPTNVDPPEDHR